MDNSEDCPPLPHVRPDPQVLQILRSPGVGAVSSDEAYARLCSVMAAYLWPGAAERHGRVVGARIVRRRAARGRGDSGLAATARHGRTPPGDRRVPPPGTSAAGWKRMNNNGRVRPGSGPGHVGVISTGRPIWTSQRKWDATAPQNVR